MIKIIKNNMICTVDKQHAPLFEKCLKYKSTFYVDGQYAKKKKENLSTFWFNRRKGVFHTGLLERVVNFLQKRKIEFEVIEEDVFEVLLKERDPYIDHPNIDYKAKRTIAQIKAVHEAIEKQRGIIQLPTGTGKTIVSFLLMSAFPSARVLFLCHSIELLYQTKEELLIYGFKNVRIIGDGVKEKYLNLKSCIVIAIDKSFIKEDPEKYSIFFDIVIVDEAHHQRSEKSYFSQILFNCLAPVKIGLTATPNTSGKDQLVQEGYLGPIISQLTVKEAIENKMLVPIKLNLVPVPTVTSISNLTKYNDTYIKEKKLVDGKQIDKKKRIAKGIYTLAVVESKIRNKLVVEESLKFGTCLIMVKELKHGRNIFELFQNIYPEVKVKFVQGKVDGKERVRIKKDLNDKKLDVVIATTVWKEGVNIPTLRHVINAAGYKSDIPSLQIPGRGSRTSEGKDHMVLTDFIDLYRPLALHFAHRMTAYKKSNWI